jgi:hypothetical protein
MGHFVHRIQSFGDAHSPNVPKVHMIILYHAYPSAVIAHLLAVIMLSSGTKLRVLQYPLDDPNCHCLPVAKHPFVHFSPSCKQPDITQDTCLYEYPWLHIVKYFVETL